MKTCQPQLRAISQFDSGRWKLRLELVPVDPDNETTIGMAFDSARKPALTRPMRHIGSCCHRAPRIIIQTTYDTDEEIYQAIKAGAKGYLLKDAPLEELLDSIRKVHAGET